MQKSFNCSRVGGRCMWIWQTLSRPMPVIRTLLCTNSDPNSRRIGDRLEWSVQWHFFTSLLFQNSVCLSTNAYHFDISVLWNSWLKDFQWPICRHVLRFVDMCFISFLHFNEYDANISKRYLRKRKGETMSRFSFTFSYVDAFSLNIKKKTIGISYM